MQRSGMKAAARVARAVVASWIGAVLIIAGSAAGRRPETRPPISGRPMRQRFLVGSPPAASTYLIYITNNRAVAGICSPPVALIATLIALRPAAVEKQRIQTSRQR
jgi:hypothetical protein